MNQSHVKGVQLKPTSILDADQVDEVIHFPFHNNNGDRGGFYYTKYRYRTIDFNGKSIEEKEKHIRTKSIWFADVVNQQVEEFVPYGEYDIEALHIAQHHLYFIKVLDKDGDGRLDESDYERGVEIWRIHKQHRTIEFCFDCRDFNFHGFETTNDEVVVFRSEDTIPDTTELVFIDIGNQKQAVLRISRDEGDDNNYDFRFVEDTHNNPTHLITKRWIFEGGPSSPTHTMNCIAWGALLKQLKWLSIVE